MSVAAASFSVPIRTQTTINEETRPASILGWVVQERDDREPRLFFMVCFANGYPHLLEQDSETGFVDITITDPGYLPAAE